jgi:uncharacterized membrane protein YqjE
MGHAERVRAAPGFVDLLRGLGATRDIVHVRAELFALELREETERRTHVARGGGGAFLALSLALVAFLVIIFFWDTYRLTAATGVTLSTSASARGIPQAARGDRAVPCLQARVEKDLEALKANHGVRPKRGTCKRLLIARSTLHRVKLTARWEACGSRRWTHVAAALSAGGRAITRMATSALNLLRRRSEKTGSGYIDHPQWDRSKCN